jgi:lysophospholipase L1-like esterase
LINDETLTDLCNFDPNIAPYCQARPATQNDLLTLSSGSVIGTLANPTDPSTPLGVAVPLSDQYVLIPSEQNEINTRAGAFNQIIGQAVAQNSDRLALYDITAGFPGNPNTNIGAFADLFGLDGELGINIQGQLLQPDFSPNGVFSTDGIHPNQRGYAILANEIIDVIEAKFGASIPDVNVLNRPSVQLCAGDCVSDQQQQKPLVGKIHYDESFAR